MTTTAATAGRTLASALLAAGLSGCSFDGSGFGAVPEDMSAGTSATTTTGSSGADTGAATSAGATAEPTGAAETTAAASATTGGATTIDETTTAPATGTTEAPCSPLPLFVDGDGDGFGDDAQPVQDCPAPGLVPTGGDCDDGDPAIHPGQGEACNTLDDDCDLLVDEFDLESNLACGACTYVLAGNRLYAFCSGARTWGEARTDCQQRGLDLAIELDWTEHNLLLQYTPYDSGQWYIGGGDGDNNQEGKWKWIDGLPVPMQDGRWAGGQPDAKGSMGNGADCLSLVAYGPGPNQGRWVDESCGSPHRWICEGDPI